MRLEAAVSAVVCTETQDRLGKFNFHIENRSFIHGIHGTVGLRGLYFEGEHDPTLPPIAGRPTFDGGFLLGGTLRLCPSVHPTFILPSSNFLPNIAKSFFYTLLYIVCVRSVLKAACV